MAGRVEKVGCLRRFQVVTTFSAKGFQQYGERMLASVEKHWPRDIPIIVYVEGFELPATSRGIARDLNKIGWLTAFKQRHEKNSSAHGRGRTGPYDFRFDAVRFAHKVAAVIDAGQFAIHMFSPAGLSDCLIWLDGDTLAHADMPMEAMEGFMPDDKAVAWLNRTHSYPECGLVIYNLKHPGVANLFTHWRRLYETDALFDLRETHDSFVLEHLVGDLGLPTHSLSGDAVDSHHPAANGPMSAFVDHLKGDRKKAGRTPKSERRVKDGNPYWS
jgi:hypothetical protein